MKNLTKLTTSGLFASCVVFASEASAADTGWGSKVTTGNPGGVVTDLDTTIKTITNYILGIIFLIAVLIVIYGGVLYLTSAGNQDMVDRAKKTIVNGIIGMAICGLAYALISVVSSLFTLAT